MSNFLEFIFYAFITLWLLAIVFRWLFPFLLNAFLKYLQKKALSEQNVYSKNSYSSDDSQTKKTFNSPKEKVGQYVDFEEID